MNKVLKVPSQTITLLLSGANNIMLSLGSISNSNINIKDSITIKQDKMNIKETTFENVIVENVESISH